MRFAVAKVFWAIHDYLKWKEPFNRLGCYIAFGKTWEQMLSDDHHCGFDFEQDEPTAKCVCGAIATNPFFIKGEQK